jgi:hypothetical protein
MAASASRQRLLQRQYAPMTNMFGWWWEILLDCVQCLFNLRITIRNFLGVLPVCLSVCVAVDALNSNEEQLPPSP